jgi:uncharacterized protein YebE (UPF0316 family)
VPSVAGWVTRRLDSIGAVGAKLNRAIRLATLLGFFESLIWVIAASLVFANLTSPLRMVAFAGGFAMGILVGGLVERRIAMGTAFVRVVAPIASEPVAPALRAEGFAVTVINAEGMDGEVRLSFMVMARRDTARVLALMHAVNPGAFVTVEEVTVPEIERYVRRAPLVRK